MGFNSAFKGLNAELNPICHLLALLGDLHILHVSRIRVNLNCAWLRSVALCCLPSLSWYSCCLLCIISLPSSLLCDWDGGGHVFHLGKIMLYNLPHRNKIKHTDMWCSLLFIQFSYLCWPPTFSPFSFIPYILLFCTFLSTGPILYYFLLPPFCQSFVSYPNLFLCPLMFVDLCIIVQCPTHYQTWHFFNNFTTNEDIATKFEADLPHCVRNYPQRTYSCSNFVAMSSLVLELLKKCWVR